MGVGAWMVAEPLYTGPMADDAEGIARVYPGQHVNGEGRVDRLYSCDALGYWDAAVYSEQCDAYDAWDALDGGGLDHANQAAWTSGTYYGPASDNSGGGAARSSGA